MENHYQPLSYEYLDIYVNERHSMSFLNTYKYDIWNEYF